MSSEPLTIDPLFAHNHISSLSSPTLTLFLMSASAAAAAVLPTDREKIMSMPVDEGCIHHCYEDVVKVALAMSLGHEEGVVLCWRRKEW